MRKVFLLVTLLSICGISRAYEKRDLLQKKASLQQVQQSLVSKKEWIKYPAYQDRGGWDAFTGSLKEEIIKNGKKYLDYQWKVITASNYLEYERSGSRVAMEGPFNANNTALSYLVFAELAEGKGRFMDQIINGVWHDCEMTSWALSAHLPVQKSKRSLPDDNEQIIDLTAGDLGSFLSWTYYFFHDQWDKVNPVITAKLRQNIQDRILQPYMERSDFWWQALNYKPGTLVNNWNPWCNFNVLTSFLLMEEDQQKLAAAVHRSMSSVDEFLNYVQQDGACEEGPSYWGHAAGKLYDYLQLLSYATQGKVSIFDVPMVKNMGEYISRSYVGNGWVVNFADASAKGGGEPGVIFRYGKAVGSTEMRQFAAYLEQRSARKDINEGRDFFRTIENLAFFNDLKQEQPALNTAGYTWYPQTQFCYIKEKQGFFFAAKGGFNNESHNHNDVGTFSLYADEVPMFIDAGVGTYTKKTFSSERYSIWTMQSNYHNLPTINGVPQHFGAQYKATDVSFNPTKKRFTLNIANAYPKEAGVKNWIRTYSLSANNLVINDQFELTEAKAPNQVNFLTWAKPDLSKAGVLLLQKEGRSVSMQYNAAVFEASVETIPQTDARLSNVWGSELYRVIFTAIKSPLKGQYKFLISKNPTTNRK